MRNQLFDITGKKFGKLTVVKQSGNRKAGESIWLCRCDCGRETRVTSSNIRSGHTSSCGCNRGERHGHAAKNTRSSEYQAWNAMKGRCYRKCGKDYSRYGGRGITVCDRWLESFTAFLEDMGSRPSPRHSLDRIDNNGNYEPANCRWSTPKEQCSNKCSNVVVEYDGRRLLAIEWAKITGIPSDQIAKRIGRGWSPERALTQPMRRRARSAKS